jgi:type IV pilus assembly protein PilC
MKRAKTSPSRRDLVIFSRQLGEMLQNGVTLTTSLSVFARDKDSTLGAFAEGLLGSLDRGLAFSAALELASAGVPAVLINLVRIGEQTGALSSTLREAGDWMAADDDLVRSMKTALTYPVLVVTVTLILTVGLFTTVVPKLLDVVEAIGGDLPVPTLALKAFSTVLAQPGFWLVVVGFFLLARHQWQSAEWRNKAHRAVVALLIELPTVGPALTAFYQARFATALGLLIERGAGALSALKLAQEVTGHPFMVADTKGVWLRVQEGDSIATALDARPDLYDVSLRSFVYLGESTGTLPTAMKRASELYTFLLHDRLSILKQMVEPVLTMGVGALVAFVLVATMLPLYGVLSEL